ncbi:MAG: hypothetical protein Q9162_003760 [Coniocarpon cinnabarinum]
MSTILGNAIISVQETHPETPKVAIAESLSIIAGAIIAFLGFFRLGWIVEFLSLASICAYITGSAFNIGIGQIPALLGISSKYVNNRAPTYQVVIHTLQNLKHTKLDAALGLTSLLMLYVIKYTFTYLAKKQPHRQKLYFFINTLRTIFVVLLYTLISWLVNRHHRKNPKFQILGSVPRGFTAAGVPHVTTDIISQFAGDIPVTVIVLLIEHISIAKSFGRINNYVINPSQEMIAIGVTNLLGPFLGAYPATGSFSRTAIKAKAGVRTPLAGVFSSIVVLLAIYALTAVFFYIPNSALSGVIIHAVFDLITPANTVYQFWRISPLEVLIFLAGVFVTVFSSIENGVYTTICVSVALLLYRVVKAQGRFLGRVKIHSVAGHATDSHPELALDKSQPQVHSRPAGDDVDDAASIRNIYLPLDHRDGSNPEIDVQRPYPGVFMFRFSEGYNYPNASHYTDYLVATIFRETRRTDPRTFARPGDRPWNDPGPRKGQEENIDWNKPTLKAVVLDFSSVNNVDITSVQNLIDVRNQLDRYTTPETVDWHIACVNNRWTKRALASAGFGYPTPSSQDGGFHRWKPLYSVAEMGGSNSAAAAAEHDYNRRRTSKDVEAGSSSSSDVAQKDRPEFEREIRGSKAYEGATHNVQSRVAVVQGLNRPYFHVDLTSALQNAIDCIQAKERYGGFDKKGYGTDA